MNFRLLLFFSTFLIVLNACETDIEVIAPQRDVTVIYGILDASDTRHYVRINKAFVGERSAAELAAEPGINEYSEEELVAEIYELNQQGDQTGLKWTLQSEYVYGKEEGDFFADSNKVYYFDANLNSSNRYEIRCVVNVEGEDEKIVSAVTDIVDASASVRLEKPQNNTNCQTPQRDPDNEARFVSNNDYLPKLSIQWGGARNGKSYRTFFRFYYTTFYQDGRVEKDSVFIPVGTQVIDNPTVASSQQFTFNTEEFYSVVGQQVEDQDLDVVSHRRITDTLHFFLEIMSEELTNYVQINSPQTGIIQERPEYTNVQNGIGIFSSRYVTSTRDEACDARRGRMLDRESLRELISSDLEETGFYTAAKGFCSPRFPEKGDLSCPQ